MSMEKTKEDPISGRDKAPADGWSPLSSGLSALAREHGKTALVLGGGGSRGAYELGVWQALRELDIKIDIITGTSVGAINGALIIQDDFDKALEIWKEFETSMIKESGRLACILKEHLDEEKIRASEIDFGIVATEFPSFTPHFMFKEDIPRGKMSDYILASASFFPILKIHAIGDSKFLDGAYNDNLPVGMALEKGAQHIIAIDLETIGMIDKNKLKQAKNLKTITSKWDLGKLFVFDKENTKRVLRLGYLEAMKIFNVFDGFFYTFPKSEFDANTLTCADAAAKIFQLDPCTIYSQLSLDNKLTEIIHSEAKKNRKQTLAIMISKSFREHPEKNRFLRKPVRKFFNEVINAATYLHQRQLISYS